MTCVFFVFQSVHDATERRWFLVMKKQRLAVSSPDEISLLLDVVVIVSLSPESREITCVCSCLVTNHGGSLDGTFPAASTMCPLHRGCYVRKQRDEIRLLFLQTEGCEWITLDAGSASQGRRIEDLLALGLEEQRHGVRKADREEARHALARNGRHRPSGHLGSRVPHNK